MDKNCKACKEEFIWNDDIIVVKDYIYHKNCVNLYPIGYVAYVGDEYIGETENHDGSCAFEYLYFD